MSKLVLLSAGLAGRTHELTVDKTTIGRVEDNTFQIAEASVSSHHCEILLRGSDVVVKDLNSTNGTFINGEKVTETVLKPGQVLRLGQIEMRLDAEGTVPGAAGATSAGAGGFAPPPPPAPVSTGAVSRKPAEHTMVMQRGVKLDEFQQGNQPGGFDTAGKGFSKKDNKFNKMVWVGAGILGLVIVVLLIYALAHVS
jgi:hypothetical protein